VLRLLLEKDVDLTIKNKKGQTPIDIGNSKTVIALFWNYLKKTGEYSKENKSSPGHSPKRALSKKCSAKILTKESRLNDFGGAVSETVS
jgi:hypothetical protein